MPSIDAIEAARQRRVERSGAVSVRTEWFLKEVSEKIAMTMRQRVKLATAYLQSRVVLNLSKPVVKQQYTRIVKDPTTGRRKRVSRVVVDPKSRSKPGEFPRADTTLLMKSIFNVYQEPHKNQHEGYVGTPLDYGLRLEMKMNRSFLLRTFNEEREKLSAILNGPIS